MADVNVSLLYLKVLDDLIQHRCQCAGMGMVLAGQIKILVAYIL